ncbi:unnamed protein product [Orchesella dallaii]|uniref:CID domain-containing protein n=1 Tax=Orchesella dallaii TaxID=48710 RepID=A0ABP1Q5N3_9HEXA
MGEDIVTKYSSSLAELKMNSKPLINLLTMMAEDYIRHAPSIVQVIERHLTTVRPEIKLPVLYLIDSIIKNVKKDYVELFTQNIVSTFCGVFEKVDEKTRGLLWKLRGTWSDYFPTKKLYAIDVRCHQLDPKWPITAQAPSSASIHVNPRFLNRGKATTALINPEQILAQTVIPEAVASTPGLDDSVMEVQMRAQLLAKQKELLELQTKKVELELLQTKLQMEEKARRQKEEETTKQIDMAVKQEQLLVGMAQMAKHKTERIQQQLSNLQKPSSSGSGASGSSSIKDSPSSSKGHESSSDRESHSSISSKITKCNNEASASSLENSPSKKSKSSRDRDRRDRGKNDKSKDNRHDSKEKDSRHRHRDKDRHNDNKDKEKDRHERSKDPASTVKASGEWKDYNEAKKASSKRVYRKPSGVESDEEIEDSKKDLPLKHTPSPPPMAHSPTKSGSTFRFSSDVHDDIEPSSQATNPTKSPQQFSQSGDSSSMSPGVITPLKRRLPKENKPDKDRKGRDKSDKNREKPVVSDPRLRKRQDKQKNLKSSDESNREEPTNKTGNEWKDYRERQKNVLRRTYRKNTGIEGKEEQSSESNHLLNSDIGPGDVDLRFEAPMDLDLRTEADANGTEPPAKKSRSGKDAQHNTFDDLFGHQDVDLRPNSSCWTQVKIKSENASERPMEDGTKVEEDLPRRDSLVLRSPGPPSPATSISSSRSTCDPLGRPLIYNRLPNDPEERKRSLDSRSTSIDPVEQFRAQHIDRALRSTGALSETDMKSICLKAKEELDLGLLNPDQYFAVMKQIVQINEASAMREVQQMQQVKADTWQTPTPPSATPNPWMTETDENNIWTGFCPAPRPGPTDFPGNVRFPGPNTWEQSGDLPWMAANMPVAPRGPNPFEEAIGAPAPTMVDDLVPKANEKDIRIAERDVGRPIPIDGIMRQVRFYRDATIVMMGKMSDDPRELSFQKDNAPRVVLINGKRLEVYLGETKKFDINRVPHTLKIGSPGRELYIDDRPHEMYFGGPPKKIFLEGRPHSFQLISQAPQVSVGQVPRYDLVAGRVNLTIDAVSNAPVYLDEKLQKIDVFGVPVLFRFCSNFQTVTLNGRPFPTNFGARLPFTITLHGSGKHYFRFSAITPNTETAIQAFISANYGGDWNERNNHFGIRGRGGLFRGAPGARGRGRPQRDILVDNRSAGPNPWAPETSSDNTESVSNVNPLDLLNNLFNTSSDTKNNTEHLLGSEQQPAENELRGESENAGDESSGANVNVSDLVANLIKFGLLPAATSNTPEASSAEPAAENDQEGDEKINEVGSDEVQTSNQIKDDQDAKKKEKPEKPPAPTIPPLPTVDVTFDENMKEKRNIAIAQIFTGVQCSQCGLRFPPDQTLRYSQHLDWHFRQNRREKSNARKALSRKWYYDMSDWIQFEEIEDLEERAASLFENQETENENDLNSPSTHLNPEDYTVLASSHEGSSCPQCGETFESYFDEEREEWRLKNSKLDDCDGEQKLYHPNCYEDYLKSLVEESMVEDPEVEEQEQEAKPEQHEEEESTPKPEDEDDEVLIIKEGKKEVVVMEIDIDDDDVEKNDTVNEIVNEENHSIDLERKTDDNLIQKDDNIQTDSATSGIDNALDNTRNELVQSPILIDEDSTFLPGLSEDAEGWVFGFAREVRREIITDQESETKIIYAPMKFDIPRIKVEPLDEDEPTTEETLNPDEFLSNLQPYLSSSVRSPGGSEPMNVDLTEEDSLDAVDSGARLVNQTRTSIDGNLQHEESATLPFIPASKLRINIFGMDSNPSSSPKDKDKVGSPVSSRGDEGTSSQEEALVKDNGNENNIISNNMEMNKDNPVDPVLTEEVKRLKPRLVGRKLTNCPPKITGTEESGLCVIC